MTLIGILGIWGIVISGVALLVGIANLIIVLVIYHRQKRYERDRLLDNVGKDIFNLRRFVFLWLFQRDISNIQQVLADLDIFRGRLEDAVRKLKVFDKKIFARRTFSKLGRFIADMKDDIEFFRRFVIRLQVVKGDLTKVPENMFNRINNFTLNMGVKIDPAKKQIVF